MNTSEIHSQDRVIRVFISSTFRDMMRERDLLVKEVFPELRRKCAKRFVTFTEVDLRWGITEAQANEGQVLPLCLAEIERSRPYFIGLLGERYGWIPDTILPDVIAREPWLQEHVQGRTSVTELEILHGVLNNPKMLNHAFFYFRDPVYLNDPMLTIDERRDMIERNIKADLEKYGPDEATRRTKERMTKLVALKQRIRDSKLPLVESYANPKALAEIVHNQFNKLIDHLYPEEQTPDLLLQERMAHEAHAKNKLFACIDRPVHLAALNTFATPAEHNGKGFVVTGDSGGGKTALLAAWARDWAKNHPEDFLFQHYFGATPDSASPEGFLRRLMGELKSHFNITDEIPTDSEKLRNALPVWLAQTIGKAKVVLVLDGLNQVQGSEPDRHLLFLPRHFPPHVTVLASALPGPALETLHERTWTEHDLPHASDTEIEAMVSEYLKIHARTLEPDLQHELVNANGAKNPLFLRTVLEELRQFGSFEQLPQRVRHYLKAENPKELFLRVLTRWQEDFDGKDMEQEKPKLDLVHRALTHLWAARKGLAESEWLDLLGDGMQPLPRNFWTPLFLALESHLSHHTGLFAFGHDFLRQAVETAFVSTPDLQKAAHLSLADYFEDHGHQQEMTPRKATEWPHQLHSAHAWDRLEACLTDIPLFLALYRVHTKLDLVAYWLPLRKQGRNLDEIYEAAYVAYSMAEQEPRHRGHLANELGLFLYENDYYKVAESLLHRAVFISENEGGQLDKQFLTSLSNVAILLVTKGQYDAAESLFRQTLAGRQRMLGLEHPNTLQSIDNLAVCLMNRGDIATAELLLQRELAESMRILGRDHPQTLTCSHNIARLHTEKGEYASAEPLYRYVVEIEKRILGPEHPALLDCINNFALMLERKGEYNESESLYRQVLRSNEIHFGSNSHQSLKSMTNLGVLLIQKGDYTSADRLCRGALEGLTHLLGTDHPNTLASMNNLANLLEHKGDLPEAERLYRITLESLKRILGPEHPDTLLSINNLAHILETIGNLAEAEALQRQALEIQEKILGSDHPMTLVSANNLAMVLASIGDIDGAEHYCRRTLEGRIRVLGPNNKDTLTSLDNLGGIKRKQGFLKDAEELRRRALQGFEDTLGPEDPHTITTVGNLALVLDEQGKSFEAEVFYWRSFKSQQKVHGPDDPNTLLSLRSLSNFYIVLNNNGNSLYFNEDYCGAEPFYRRSLVGAVAISRSCKLEMPDLQTFLGNYINCLVKLGRNQTEIRRVIEEVING